MRSRWMNASGGVILTVVLVQSGGAGQSPAAQSGDWPMYRGDVAGSGYSPLTQINPSNVAKLTHVWAYRLESDAPVASSPGGKPPAGVNSQATPIVVNRVMYVPAANRV